VGAEDAWLWWVVATLALGIAEVFTTFLVFGMFAVGALAAALAASLGAGVVPQAVGFVVVSAALLLVVRPIARRHMRAPPQQRLGVAALVGQRALVVERVDEYGGRVKIGGEIWTARTIHPEQILEPGTAVDVVEIQGATALVFGPEQT
jgi:membrane protein implicated in regulation of membrane protease activity